MFVFTYVETRGHKEFLLSLQEGAVPSKSISIQPIIQGSYPCLERDDEAVHLFYHLFALRHKNSILTFGEAVRASCFDAFCGGYVGDMNRPQSDPSFLGDHRYLADNEDSMQVFEEVLRLTLHSKLGGPVHCDWGGSMRGVLAYLLEESWGFGHEVWDAKQ